MVVVMDGAFTGVRSLRSEPLRSRILAIAAFLSEPFLLRACPFWRKAVAREERSCTASVSSICPSSSISSFSAGFLVTSLDLRNDKLPRMPPDLLRLCSGFFSSWMLPFRLSSVDRAASSLPCRWVPFPSSIAITHTDHAVRLSSQKCHVSCPTCRKQRRYSALLSPINAAGDVLSLIKPLARPRRLVIGAAVAPEYDQSACGRHPPISPPPSVWGLSGSLICELLDECVVTEFTPLRVVAY